MSTTSKTYRPQLDGLRALAVAAVAWSHWMPARYQGGLEWGSLGVQLFFVLSGFLITGILQRARTACEARGLAPTTMLRGFYARRFLRIFPLYYAVILLAALADLPPARETLGWNAAYLSNFLFFVENRYMSVVSHFWSLAVEEQFYLVWPWVMALAPRRRLLPVTVAAVVAAPLFRMGLRLALPDHALGGVLPLSCLDALGAGALLALLGPVAARRYARAALALGLPLWLITAPFAGHHLLAGELGRSASAAVFVWVVAGANRGFGGGARRLLEHQTARYLGSISYGLYVLHLFAETFVAMLVWGLSLPQALYYNIWLRLPVMIGLTVGLAALSWRYFEHPLNRLKSRFPYLPPAAAPDPLPAAPVCYASPVVHTAFLRTPFDHPQEV